MGLGPASPVVNKKIQAPMMLMIHKYKAMFLCLHGKMSVSYPEQPLSFKGFWEEIFEKKFCPQGIMAVVIYETQYYFLLVLICWLSYLISRKTVTEGGCLLLQNPKFIFSPLYILS